MTLIGRFVVGALVALAVGVAHAAPLSVSREADGLTVRVGELVFTRYLLRSGARPVLWPVNGPTGAALTRAYPVGPAGAGESTDHVHHRSFWIGYEGLNGVDFWHEPEEGRERALPIGVVEHRELLRADATGDTATVATANDWRAPDGRVVCHDKRELVFRAGDDWRSIDLDLQLWSSDGPLVINDTKEGMIAVRVAGSIKVKANLGGRILSSRGAVNRAAWGRPAEWVDYSGPIDGGRGGIALFSHPGNDRPTPRWHVRPYGLFAANPIGVGPYLADDEPRTQGGLTLDEGQAVRLRYRLWLHGGDASPERLDAVFRDYGAEQR